jgi:hypothetical protein
VLAPARDDVEVALVEHDLAVPVADREGAAADKEELVFLGVGVPDELALDLGDLDVLPVRRSDDAGDQYSVKASNARSMLPMLTRRPPGTASPSAR